MGVLSFRAFLADLPGCFRRASFGNTLAIASEKVQARLRQPHQGAALIARIAHALEQAVAFQMIDDFTHDRLRAIEVLAHFSHAERTGDGQVLQDGPRRRTELAALPIATVEP